MNVTDIVNKINNFIIDHPYKTLFLLGFVAGFMVKTIL